MALLGMVFIQRSQARCVSGSSVQRTLSALVERWSIHQIVLRYCTCVCPACAVCCFGSARQHAFHSCQEQDVAIAMVTGVSGVVAELIPLGQV
mmetsp:Transcript_59197/g.129665  ORF Transcript_59197/g.129665 Transcript_59197/m.129665 type:complete len:93 (-) Transcript_59197:354-632(-)